MLTLHQLDDTYQFPPVSSALEEPNGLLAFGGDLSEARLLSAYSNGIFPWFSDGEPFLWWSPNPRGVIELDDFKVSKSLKKSFRKYSPKISLNKAFCDVIKHCAHIPRNFGANPQSDTWITQEMQQAYVGLHNAGFASSVEVWIDNELCGGLYGVTINSVFCGESMFHTKTDASKLAIAALVQHMKQHQLGFIDCQMSTSHLASLGCKDISRESFTAKLAQCSQAISKAVWAPQDLALTL